MRTILVGQTGSAPGDLHWFVGRPPAAASPQEVYRGYGSGSQPEVLFTTHPDWAWVSSLTLLQLHQQFPLDPPATSVDHGFVWGQQVPFEIRHAQVSFDPVGSGGRGMRWGVAAGYPDEPELVRRGYFGAGPGRDLSHLGYADRHMLVYSLLQPRTSKRQPKGRFSWVKVETKQANGITRIHYKNPWDSIEQAILATCPRFGAFPVIDFDCGPAVTDRDKDAVIQRARDSIYRILGIHPASFSPRDTGGTGRHIGVSVDQRFRHTHLYDIVRDHILKPALKGVAPYLSDFKGPKETRPSDYVSIDTGIWVRDPSNRGGQWRGLGCPRPGGGRSLYAENGILQPLGAQNRDLFLSFAMLKEGERKWQEARLEEVLRGGGNRPRGEKRPQKDRRFTNVDHLTSLNETSTWVSNAAPIVGPHDLRLAMSSTLLKFGIPDVATASVLAAGTGNLDDANETVRSTKDRMASGSPVKGLAWVRRVLGSDRVVDLGAALSKDTGKPLFETLARVLGKDLFSRSGKHVPFLLELHKSLDHEVLKRIGNALRRPTFCGTTADVARTKEEGRVCYTCVHRCDSKLCPDCAMRRIEDERRMLGDMWKDQGPFQVLEIEGLPTMAHARALQKYIRRFGRPRIWSWGIKGGKPKALIVTNSQSDVLSLSAHCKDWLFRNKLKHLAPKRWVEYTDHVEAGDKVLLNKLSWHLHGRDLVESQAGSGLVRFLEDGYNVHLITRSTRGLKWPTAEQIKADKAKDRESTLDYEGQELSHNLVHLATQYVIHTQDRPHSFDQAMSLTNNCGALKEHIRKLNGQPSSVGTDSAGNYYYTVQAHDVLAVPIPA